MFASATALQAHVLKDHETMSSVDCPIENAADPSYQSKHSLIQPSNSIAKRVRVSNQLRHNTSPKELGKKTLFSNMGKADFAAVDHLLSSGKPHELSVEKINNVKPVDFAIISRNSGE